VGGAKADGLINLGEYKKSAEKKKQTAGWSEQK